jgi:MFS family permease
MTPYLTSYLREYNGANIRYAHTVWIFTAVSIAYSLAAIIGGLVNSILKINTKPLVLFGCFVMSLGVGLTYFSIKESFSLTFLTYGVINGFGTGFAYLGSLSVATKVSALYFFKFINQLSDSKFSQSEMYLL